MSATPTPESLTPGTRVLLVRVFGDRLPAPIPGTVDRYIPRTCEVQVTHDAHDCDPALPVGSLGFDFWPIDEIEIAS
jgi:hypothetical protein